MNAPDSHITDAEGVAAVEHRILELGWLFRRQFGFDYGIDAQIEARVDSQPTGRLLGVQIKSGPSYFKDGDEDAILFRGELKHLDYWLDHDLTVIVILHEPETKYFFWQEVTAKNAVRGTNSWKMLIPKKQTLEQTSLDHLLKIASRNKEIKEEHEVDREEFHCPFCNAELVERGNGPVSEDHIWEYKIFACGYRSIDSVLEEPCPSDPRFPKFEDFEIQCFETENEWYCRVRPKTEMARRLSLLPQPGRTKEEAIGRVRESYDRRAKRR